MTMKLILQRINGGPNDTIGMLWIQGEGFKCWTLEDEYRREKIPGETRIPPGNYEIELRRANSKLHKRYRERFPWHFGMLQLRNVPGFTDIYIHILNVESETDGCIGVGDTVETNVDGFGALAHSTRAYERLYKRVAPAIDLGKEEVRIIIRDEIRLEEALWQDL